MGFVVFRICSDHYLSLCMLPFLTRGLPRMDAGRFTRL
jgi:hypothetical protein